VSSAREKRKNARRALGEGKGGRKKDAHSGRRTGFPSSPPKKREAPSCWPWRKAEERPLLLFGREGRILFIREEDLTFRGTGKKRKLLFPSRRRKSRNFSGRGEGYPFNLPGREKRKRCVYTPTGERKLFSKERNMLRLAPRKGEDGIFL